MTDGRFTIVFNGEIYNYRELRAAMIAEGSTFSTQSDTEVLLRLFAREGTACLEKLIGMFAFAVWDDTTHELVIARDRVGEKPLYYAEQDSCLYFASSYDALRSIRGRALDVDPFALDAYLDLGYVPAPLAITRDIRKLEAGTFLRAAGGRTSLERYWSVAADLPPFVGTLDDAIDRLDEMANRAVALRLRSDVPLGVFLSGGIDSSLVAALAVRHSAEPVLSFSIAFDEVGFDESGFARAVARHIGSDHRVFPFEPDLARMLPDVVRHYGEPFAESSALPIWLMAEQTRRHVTVAVGGDGGDEAFAGYNWYFNAARLGRIRSFVPGILARAGAGLAPGKAGRALDFLALEEPDRFAALRSFMSAAETRDLYAGELAEVRRDAARRARAQLADRYREVQGSALRRMRTVDFDTYLADCLLPKVDIATMAHGLEARAPLLDPDLVRFALSLPDRFVAQNGVGKIALRRLLSRYVPDHLFERPKQGFTVPLGAWFRTSLRPVAHSLAEDGPLLDSGWIRPDGLRRILREHDTGRRDHERRIYSLLVLSYWLAAN